MSDSDSEGSEISPFWRSKYDFIQVSTLTPRVCLKYPSNVLEWLDEYEKDKTTKLVLPHEPENGYDSIPVFLAPLDAKEYNEEEGGYNSDNLETEFSSGSDDVLSEFSGTASQPDIDYELNILEARDYNEMPYDELTKHIATGHMLVVEKLVNPSEEIIDYIVDNYPELFFSIKTITQEMCNHYHSKGLLACYIPRQFITDEMIEIEWPYICRNVSSLASYPQELFNREMKVDIIASRDYLHGLAKASKHSKDLFLCIAKNNVHMIEYCDVPESWYQEAANLIIDDIPAGGIDVYTEWSGFSMVDDFRCEDYEALCNRVLAKNPYHIITMQNPSYEMACDAMSRIKAEGRVDIKSIRPGDHFGNIPPEFLDTWPHIVLHESCTEQQCVDAITKDPSLFKYFRNLTPNIIRCGIENCRKN